ncbi:MAG: sensor histidine kinase [Proteobacteria bacterium]|nr:sensor histidine kinase [Pseudomonadota bacterium]MBU1638960.1 sensor histidine kinase [Pseudomonadota bacterium]
MAEQGKRAGTFDVIRQRIKVKREDYKRYKFTDDQNNILKTFFDLAQEFDSLVEFYSISVLILPQYMDVICRLYLMGDGGTLQLVQASDKEPLATPQPAPASIQQISQITRQANTLLLPIFLGIPGGKREESSGVFEVIAPQKISQQVEFFLEKFTNRLAVSLTGKLAAHQSLKHIEFVSNLVTDIEHNVIIPNMYFKHLFNKLRKKIKDMDELEQQIKAMKEAMGMTGNESCQKILDKVASLHKSLDDYHQEMEKHHKSSSLFIESLFRRDHFTRGELVLRTRKCIVVDEIIAPQLEHYHRRFLSQGVVVEHPVDMQDEEIVLQVDVGLLAQVYANLFSNALKYTETVDVDGGLKQRKALAYGREFVKDCFGPGIDGVKFNVFTTGHHLSPEDAAKIFDEGCRGTNVGNQLGTGHGLSFVRQVVEIHGGSVGYEPVLHGNNFWFCLPLPKEEGDS